MTKEEEVKNGTFYEYYMRANGSNSAKVKYEKEYEDGKLVKVIAYHRNGKKFSETYFQDGKIVAISDEGDKQNE